MTASRRAFLKSAASLGGAAICLGAYPLRTLAALLAETGDSPGDLGDPGESGDPNEIGVPGGAEGRIWLPPAAGGKLPEQSQLCTITDARMLDSFGNLRADFLLDVLHRLLKELTGEALTRDTWKQFFRPDDIIGIKFDPLAADVFGTNAAFARAIVASLAENGFRAGRIMLIDPPAALGALRWSRSPLPLQMHATPRGYLEEPLVVDSRRKTHLSRALSQVTALLNVPTIKDHRQLGMACGLANMALGMINNPGAFTADYGDPGLAALAAMKEIGGKHRLTIVNGIRGTYDRGPRADADGGNVWCQHSIIMSADVVAADAKALELLDTARQSHNLPSLDDAGRPARYLAAADRLGLGHARSTRIRTRHVSM